MTGPPAAVSAWLVLMGTLLVGTEAVFEMVFEAVFALGLTGDPPTGTT